MKHQNRKKMKTNNICCEICERKFDALQIINIYTADGMIPVCLSCKKQIELETLEENT